MNTESENSEKFDDSEHSELLAIYGVTISDIAFFKSQQWKATNYAVLIYAAVLGTAKLVSSAGDLTNISFGLLFLMALLTLLQGLYVLNELESSLSARRVRLDLIIHLFAEKIYESFYKNSLPPEDKSSLIWLFRTVLIIGFLIDVWILILWKYSI